MKGRLVAIAMEARSSRAVMTYGSSPCAAASTHTAADMALAQATWGTIETSELVMEVRPSKSGFARRACAHSS